MKRLTTKQFIENAKAIHGDRYDYSQVVYVNSRTKINIICKLHGLFTQSAINHRNGQGCPKCGAIYAANFHRKTAATFVSEAKKVHGNKYDYSKVEYVNTHTKVTIVCCIHGKFSQTPVTHLYGGGCPKCMGRYNKKYYKDNIPLYDRYFKQLAPYGNVCRRNPKDANILDVKCVYCKKWYTPSGHAVCNRTKAIKRAGFGEHNLYCSSECKDLCPDFKRQTYPKGFKVDKVDTSREVQPELRKLRFEIDNHKCQVCFTDKNLHCHHYEGVEINPIESADLDNCTTICKTCHKDLHKLPGYTNRDYRRKPCKVLPNQ